MRLKAASLAFSRYLSSYFYKPIPPVNHQRNSTTAHITSNSSNAHTSKPTLQTPLLTRLTNSKMQNINLITVSDCFTLFTLNISTNREGESGRSTRYPDRLHNFSVTIPRWHKDVYVNSFFFGTARLYNYLSAECFPLI